MYQNTRVIKLLRPAAVEAPLEVLVMNTLNGQELCRVSFTSKMGIELRFWRSIDW
jgi:hypothetical protein